MCGVSVRYVLEQCGVSANGCQNDPRGDQIDPMPLLELGGTPQKSNLHKMTKGSLAAPLG